MVREIGSCISELERHAARGQFSQRPHRPIVTEVVFGSGPGKPAKCEAHGLLEAVAQGAVVKIACQRIVEIWHDVRDAAKVCIVDAGRYPWRRVVHEGLRCRKPGLVRSPRTSRMGGGVLVMYDVIARGYLRKQLEWRVGRVVATCSRLRLRRRLLLLLLLLVVVVVVALLLLLLRQQTRLVRLLWLSLLGKRMLLCLMLVGPRACGIARIRLRLRIRLVPS